jgi:hypothetical protein
MIIVRLLSPEPVGWLQHHQLYSGMGADIVMESFTTTTVFVLLDATFHKVSDFPVLAVIGFVKIASAITMRGVNAE